MNIMMFLHNGTLNRGCEAIVRSGIQIIKSRLPNVKVNVSSFRPETDKIISTIDKIYDGNEVQLKKYSFNWIIGALYFKLFKDETYTLRIMNQNVIRNAKENDICLSVGGDAYCYGEQDGWYEINKALKKQGKKLVLWGCSIGEEDMSDKKLNDLKNFDLILPRETITYNMLKSKGLTNVKLCADGAFIMESEELPLPQEWNEGNTIGLNFSPLVWKRNKESQVAVRDLIHHILNTTNMTIALTPHVTEIGNNDYEVLSQYYEEFKNTGRVIILPDNLNAMQYKGYIARMRFFIGARTHATIAAYSNCIPTMVLGYSVKSKGIAKDIFGEEKLVLGIDEISNSDKLKSKFDEMLNEELELKERLKNSIPNIKEMSYKAAKYLAELIAE